MKPKKNHCARRALLRGIALSGVALALLGASATAAADGLDREFIKSDELRLMYYQPGETDLVPHAAESFLSALDAHKRLWGYVPDGRLNVFLKDLTDRGNGSSYVAPWNQIDFEIAASNEPYETFSSADRFAATAVHELTHIATMDRAAPSDARLRRFFFGKVEVDAAHPESLLYNYLTVPRATTPRWYLEGSAVFVETWMEGGVGRAQGGYDEMVFRAMVHDDARFFRPLGLVSKGTEIDFQTGANAYLYGTRFMDYLAFTYGPDKLLAWWRRDAGSRRYFADQFQQVFGLKLEESWQQWITFEHGFQQQNLKAVHEHPITEVHDLTKRDLGAVSRSYLSRDGSKILAAIRYPGQVAHIVAIGRSDGAVTPLQEIKGARGYTVTSLAYDSAHETLFYTTNNNTFRNIEALDLHTGKARMLLHAARIGDIVYNPTDRSLWGLRFLNGFVELVRVPFPYRSWQTLHVFPSYEAPFDLDLSPDGTLASVSVSGPGARAGAPQQTQVRIMRTADLIQGNVIVLHKFSMGSAVPEGFVFSADGRYLFGSSFYTGVSNIYRYEIATETVAAVSNAELGFFRPLPIDASHLIVLRYSARGFVPTLIEAQPTEDLSAVTFLGEQVAAKHPEVQRWVAANPSSMSYEAMTQSKRAYVPWQQLSMESLIPIIEGYQSAKALGVSARFSDPALIERIQADLSYSPDTNLPTDQRLHASVTGREGNWTAGAAWNGANFYDLFGPTRRSLAGYNGFLGYDRPLIFDPPQTLDFVAKIAYYGDLVTLPGFQNVLSPTRNLLTGSAGLVSIDTRSSPGAVDAETGHSWSIKAHVYEDTQDFIPSLAGTFNIGFPLALDHSSIWLRTGAAVSAGSRNNPLSSFYLGGFGNNYVDTAAYGPAQRYRELLGMPGFELDALQGKSLVKGMLEWSLPPLRFEDLGTPGFYASWARPEIFVGALETDLTSATYRQSAQDIGAQLDVQLHVMHRQPMMLSLGVARGFGGGGLSTTEFMISLQVL